MPPVGKLHFGVQFTRLANVIGVTAATLLCERYGGSENIYIPVSPETEHKFKGIVGEYKFKKLTGEFGGDKIDIPKSPKLAPMKAAIITGLIDDKLTTLEISRKTGCTQRYVRMVSSELRDLGIRLPANNHGAQYQ